MSNNLEGEYAQRACCILGVRGSLIRQDRAAARALTAAILEAQDWVQANPDQLAARGIGIDTSYPLFRYFLWAKHNELALGAEAVGKTVDQGDLRADDEEVGIEIGGIGRDRTGDPGIARRDHDLAVPAQRIGERVLPTAGSDDDHPHVSALCTCSFLVDRAGPGFRPPRALSDQMPNRRGGSS